MSSSRPVSYRKARRSMLHGPKSLKTDWADWYRKRQILYSTLNRLKRDNLVIKKERSGRSLWKITERGLKYIQLLNKQKNKRAAELPRKKYEKKDGSDLVIVSFDVPEKERQKRRWLRFNLLSFGFSQLQKSVWLGTGGIPEEFIEDLYFYGMKSYVHIFSVNKRGTVDKI